MTRYLDFLPEFAVHNRPWHEYLSFLGRQDSKPYHASPLEAPMYRGRKKGQEGWIAGETVQLHYNRFPDEHLFCSLNRWRTGELTGDIGLQQFRNAQPHPLMEKDEHSFATPDAEEYMKLNYKNPKVYCKYLTRAGTFYPRDTLKISPEAHNRLQQAVVQAKTLGLFPKFGNPFWHRLQANKPKPYMAEYRPDHASTKQTMEQFCFHWLQAQRIKSYFQEKEKERKSKELTTTRPSQRMMDDGYWVRPNILRRKEENLPSNPLTVSEQSYIAKTKETMVPGFMSVAGLRKNPFLWASDKKKHIGFRNVLEFKAI